MKKYKKEQNKLFGFDPIFSLLGIVGLGFGFVVNLGELTDLITTAEILLYASVIV